VDQQTCGSRRSAANHRGGLLPFEVRGAAVAISMERDFALKLINNAAS
jgi:hypothetical protein